jgi:hypothetical protein
MATPKVESFLPIVVAGPTRQLMDDFDNRAYMNELFQMKYSIQSMSTMLAKLS